MSRAGALHAIVARAANRLTGHDNRLRRLVTPVYDQLLHLLSVGRGLPRSLNGEEFLVDPRVRYLLLEQHEPAVAEYLSRRVKPGDVCVNAGANLGFYALPLARWSAPGGRVVAFEPNPGTAAILARHVRMNALTDRVRVEACAVGSRAGHASLFDTRAGSGISRIGAPHPYHGDRRTRSMEVPIVTIDEYCSSRRIRPDWMIVDVEGFELEVLRGARQTILQCGPELSILVEMHPYMWDDEAQQRAEARQLFAELRRRPVAIDGRSDALDGAGVVVLEADG